MPRMPEKIEISHRTIIFAVFFVILLRFLYYINDIILQLVVAMLITAILNPTVTKLHKRGVPRAASVLIVYFAVLAFFIFSFVVLTPALIDQTTRFATSLPRLIGEVSLPLFVVENLTDQFTTVLSALPAHIVKIGVSVFSNTISLLAVIIFALYFLLYRERLEPTLSKLLPEQIKVKVIETIGIIETRLGGWARGQFILMVTVGITTYIGLLILGVPFAVPLALIAGILEIIPNIGPFLSAVPAVIVGFGISPLTGIATAALYFLIQQIENYVFVPKVMEKSAGVNPIMTLLALVIGFRVAGVVGAVLSVPTVITLEVIFSQYFSSKK